MAAREWRRQIANVCVRERERESESLSHLCILSLRHLVTLSVFPQPLQLAPAGICYPSVVFTLFFFFVGSTRKTREKLCRYLVLFQFVCLSSQTILYFGHGPKPQRSCPQSAGGSMNRSRRRCFFFRRMHLTASIIQIDAPKPFSAASISCPNRSCVYNLNIWLIGTL